MKLCYNHKDSYKANWIRSGQLKYRSQILRHWTLPVIIMIFFSFLKIIKWIGLSRSIHVAPAKWDSISLSRKPSSPRVQLRSTQKIKSPNIPIANWTKPARKIVRNQNQGHGFCCNLSCCSTHDHQGPWWKLPQWNQALCQAKSPEFQTQKLQVTWLVLPGNKSLCFEPNLYIYNIV